MEDATTAVEDAPSPAPIILKLGKDCSVRVEWLVELMQGKRDDSELPMVCRRFSDANADIIDPSSGYLKVKGPVKPDVDIALLGQSEVFFAVSKYYVNGHNHCPSVHDIPGVEPDASLRMLWPDRTPKGWKRGWPYYVYIVNPRDRSMACTLDDLLECTNCTYPNDDIGHALLDSPYVGERNVFSKGWTKRSADEEERNMAVYMCYWLYVENVENVLCTSRLFEQMPHNSFTRLQYYLPITRAQMEESRNRMDESSDSEYCTQILRHDQRRVDLCEVANLLTETWCEPDVETRPVCDLFAISADVEPLAQLLVSVLKPEVYYLCADAARYCACCQIYEWWHFGGVKDSAQAPATKGDCRSVAELQDYVYQKYIYQATERSAALPYEIAEHCDVPTLAEPPCRDFLAKAAYVVGVAAVHRGFGKNELDLLVSFALSATRVHAGAVAECSKKALLVLNGVAFDEEQQQADERAERLLKLGPIREEECGEQDDDDGMPQGSTSTETLLELDPIQEEECGEQEKKAMEQDDDSGMPQGSTSTLLELDGDRARYEGLGGAEFHPHEAVRSLMEVVNYPEAEHWNRIVDRALRIAKREGGAFERTCIRNLESKASRVLQSACVLGAMEFGGVADNEAAMAALSGCGWIERVILDAFAFASNNGEPPRGIDVHRKDPVPDDYEMPAHLPQVLRGPTGRAVKFYFESPECSSPSQVVRSWQSLQEYLRANCYPRVRGSTDSRGSVEVRAKVGAVDFFCALRLRRGKIICSVLLFHYAPEDGGPNSAIVGLDYVPGNACTHLREVVDPNELLYLRHSVFRRNEEPSKLTLYTTADDATRTAAQVRAIFGHSMGATACKVNEALLKLLCQFSLRDSKLIRSSASPLQTLRDNFYAADQTLDCRKTVLEDEGLVRLLPFAVPPHTMLELCMCLGLFDPAIVYPAYARMQRALTFENEVPAIKRQVTKIMFDHVADLESTRGPPCKRYKTDRPSISPAVNEMGELLTGRQWWQEFAYAVFLREDSDSDDYDDVQIEASVEPKIRLVVDAMVSKAQKQN